MKIIVSSENLKFGMAVSRFLNYFEFLEDEAELSLESYPDQYWTDLGPNFYELSKVAVTAAKNKIEESQNNYVEFAANHNAKVEQNVDYDESGGLLKTIPFDAPSATVLSSFCDLLCLSPQ